jgi:ABC-type multidrug transport system ATPase subunit
LGYHSVALFATLALDYAKLTLADFAVDLGALFDELLGLCFHAALDSLLFAQALLSDPELLIVDEPTVGLDPEERIRFRNLFSRDAGRRLVILSTHIIEDVESICNRLIVLHQGRIRFDGTPSELVRRAEGHVGVVEVRGDGEAALDGRFRITGRVITSQGASCRIVGSDLPQGCRPATPTLEDAYIYCMGNGAAR